MTGWRALVIGTGGVLLSGCVAAVIPVAAAGAIGKQHMSHHPHAAAPTSAAPAPVSASGVPSPGGLVATAVLPSMQYLYGSGEAAAQQVQSYMALDDFLIAKSSDRAVGHAVSSVVLAPGATIDHPLFESCGAKPLAVVLDIDETAVLNLGFESDQVRHGGAYEQRRWDDWERSDTGKVVPVPGVLDAVDVARNAGMTVIFNSDRLAANADATAAMLAAAGFGHVAHLDTLWLKGDAGAGAGKDARRWAISAKYCVVAMVGDQLGDFSDLFNEPSLDIAGRRAAVDTRDVEILWGHGWFMLPNPVYGSAVKGDFDSIFPPATRWSDPADTTPPLASGSSN